MGGCCCSFPGCSAPFPGGEDCSFGWRPRDEISPVVLSCAEVSGACGVLQSEVDVDTLGWAFP